MPSGTCGTLGRVFPGSSGQNSRGTERCQRCLKSQGSHTWPGLRGIRDLESLMSVLSSAVLQWGISTWWITMRWETAHLNNHAQKLNYVTYPGDMVIVFCKGSFPGTSDRSCIAVLELKQRYSGDLKNIVSLDESVLPLSHLPQLANLLSSSPNPCSVALIPGHLSFLIPPLSISPPFLPSASSVSPLICLPSSINII